VSTIDDAEGFLEAFLDMKRAVVRSAWRIFSPLELGPMQASLMRELARNGPAAQADLARATASDPAATSRAVQSLVELGWVRRTPSTADRRAFRVEPTEVGKRAMKRIDGAYAALARSIADGLTARDLADFRRIAERVAVRERERDDGKKGRGRSR
jgi:DNA-binding MarR family transcriptional regulator